MFRAVGANCLEAGSLTITAFLQTFVFCLVHHPHVQRTAQKEIDELVGAARFPTLEDFERLPYVQAVVNEVNMVVKKFFPITFDTSSPRRTDSSLLYPLGLLTCQLQIKRCVGAVEQASMSISFSSTG